MLAKLQNTRPRLRHIKCLSASLVPSSVIYYWTNARQHGIYLFYIITKSMRKFWLVNQRWFIVPVNSWKNRASSELLLWFRGTINHLWCWKSTRRICKSLARGSWFTNSSRVLPTSRVVYQPIGESRACQTWSRVPDNYKDSTIKTCRVLKRRNKKPTRLISYFFFLKDFESKSTIQNNKHGLRKCE